MQQLENNTWMLGAVKTSNFSLSANVSESLNPQCTLKTQFAEFPLLGLQVNVQALFQAGRLPINHPAKVKKLLCSLNRTVRLREVFKRLEPWTKPHSPLCYARVISRQTLRKCIGLFCWLGRTEGHLLPNTKAMKPAEL